MPKYERGAPHHVGKKFGELEIVEVLDHEDRGRAKKQWWYRAQCSCGTVEEVNQTQLIKRWACFDCHQAAKGELVSRAKGGTGKPKTPPKPDIPDFARMKLV